MLDGTRHLFALPRGRGPSQTPKFLSPGPPSPWLPALSTNAASQPPRHPWVPLTPAELATPGASPPPGTPAAGRTSAARVQPRGCKGRSPLHKITFSPPPSPPGKGGGGIGGKKKANGRVGRRQGRQAPRRSPQRQGEPVPPGAHCPPGTPAAEARRPAAKNFPLPLDAQHKK